jgi:serine/threonine-protein kinase RsbT
MSQGPLFSKSYSSVDLMSTRGPDTSVGSVFPIRSDEDVVRLRKETRERAVEIGLSLVEQTKMITAASELARNTLRYGGGGNVEVIGLSNGIQLGIRLVFSDEGPGIADVDLALQDGYTTGGGLGLGLGGAKRLVDEFDIKTKAGEGTIIAITKWKR